MPCSGAEVSEFLSIDCEDLCKATPGADLWLLFVTLLADLSFDTLAGSESIISSVSMKDSD